VSEIDSEHGAFRDFVNYRLRFEIQKGQDVANGVQTAAAHIPGLAKPVARVILRKLLLIPQQARARSLTC